MVKNSSTSKSNSRPGSSASQPIRKSRAHSPNNTNNNNNNININNSPTTPSHGGSSRANIQQLAEKDALIASLEKQLVQARNEVVEIKTSTEISVRDAKTAVENNDILNKEVSHLRGRLEEESETRKKMSYDNAQGLLKASEERILVQTKFNEHVTTINMKHDVETSR